MEFAHDEHPDHFIPHLDFGISSVQSHCNWKKPAMVAIADPKATRQRRKQEDFLNTRITLEGGPRKKPAGSDSVTSRDENANANVHHHPSTTLHLKQGHSRHSNFWLLRLHSALPLWVLADWNLVMCLCRIQ
jgi:hypothetical protein